ncbi:MAG TPA: hypothetical protein VFH95_14650 [Candidatus Kapabacteria bacterium]|nr:hypothetical protein [Candidatus Kapabacteria bacterium]
MTKKNLSRTEQLALFAEQLLRASDYLRECYDICGKIAIEGSFSRAELREFEALTARFARLADLLLQKVLRYIGTVEANDAGTIIDIMNRAEKQSIAESAGDLSDIRELRNEIAHEYATRDIEAVAIDVLRWTPILLSITDRATQYANDLTARLP